MMDKSPSGLSRERCDMERKPRMYACVCRWYWRPVRREEECYTDREHTWGHSNCVVSVGAGRKHLSWDSNSNVAIIVQKTMCNKDITHTLIKGQKQNINLCFQLDRHFILLALLFIQTVLVGPKHNQSGWGEQTDILIQYTHSSIIKSYAPNLLAIIIITFVFFLSFKLRISWKNNS